MFESNQKLSTSNLKLTESNKKLNEKVRESKFEIFSLNRELDSTRDLYNKANDQLKVESEKYQILESDSAILVRSGFVMVQEEVMRLYPELDLSGMSVPPSITISPTPLTVHSPVQVNTIDRDVGEDDPSEDGKA